MGWLLELMMGVGAAAEHGKRPAFDPPPTFENGTRNDFLYRSARSFHAKFKSTEAEILAMLIGFNESRCKPPVSEDELAKIAHNAATQADRLDFKANTVDPNVERLSKLTPLEYDQQRKAEAKKLGVRPATLDAEVFKARPKSSAPEYESLAPPVPKPWPDPVDGLALLNALRSFLARFIVVPEHSLTTLSLWIVFTYLLDVAETSPRLAITSPTKRCGKTLVLELLSSVVFRPIASSNLSPSAVFRTIDIERCSLLLDEADAMPHKSERTEEIRGLLNSGHTRTSAFAIRNVKSGDDWIPKKFSTWAAIAIAAIGELPDTWADRSIAIPMMRKPRSVHVERLIWRNTRAGAEAYELTRKLARWAQDHKETLGEATPNLPAELDDRACNNWEMLLAVAELAAGDWPRLAHQAAGELSSGRNNAVSLSEMLIHDIRTIFEARSIIDPKLFADRISSAELCAELVKMEDRQWVLYGRARKPIDQRQVARLLKTFKIEPTTVRFSTGLTAKGYYLKSFAEVFSSYPPTNPLSERHNDTTVGGVRESYDFGFVTEPSCDGSKNGTKPLGESECDGVTDKIPQNGEVHEKNIEEAEIDRLAAADADALSGTFPLARYRKR